jgi:hypothetical protein
MILWGLKCKTIFFFLWSGSIQNHGRAPRSSRHPNWRRSGRLGARVRSRTERGERGDREDVLAKGWGRREATASQPAAVDGGCTTCSAVFMTWRRFGGLAVEGASWDALGSTLRSSGSRSPFKGHSGAAKRRCPEAVLRMAEGAGRRGLDGDDHEIVD